MSGADATFPSGTPFHTGRGRRPGRVGKVLGVGGQGVVYAAELDGQLFALKWYHDSYAAIDTALRQRLMRAVERGPPNESFLWPIDLAEMEGTGSSGYVMRLRDERFAGMRDLTSVHVEVSGG